MKKQVRSPGNHLEGVASFEAGLRKMNYFIDILAVFMSIYLRYIVHADKN